MTEYLVIYEQAGDGGWNAYPPDIPGVMSLGDTRSEVERNIREAITIHLNELRRSGQPVPEPQSEVGVVSVPAA